MTRYYRGWSAEKQRWELFMWDERREPTTEETGYESHEGPWDTRSEVPGEEDNEEEED